MKKNKGFTLIELLAVIIILAIIALIAVPTILNIINKARKSAFTDTAYGIVSAAELYYSEQQLNLNGVSEDKFFDLSSQTSTEDKLQLKGDIPTGRVIITKEGKVALAVNNERYCAVKGLDDSEVELSENLEHCYIPQTLAALSVEDVTCATNRTENACVLGTSFTLRVSNTHNENFHVIKDEGYKVTLIMNKNLGPYVAWYLDDDNTTNNETNIYGPITAIDVLDERTDDEWSNIPKRTYTYSGIGHDEQTRVYADITRTMRARLLTRSEINEIMTANNETLPDYMYGKNGNYWTSTACGVNTIYATHVIFDGRISCDFIYTTTNDGVRPVIELYK